MKHGKYTNLRGAHTPMKKLQVPAHTDSAELKPGIVMHKDTHTRGELENHLSGLPDRWRTILEMRIEPHLPAAPWNSVLLTMP